MSEPGAQHGSEALEFAKDVRQELMRLAFEDGAEVAFPAGHLAAIAQLYAAALAEARRAEREDILTALIRYARLDSTADEAKAAFHIVVNWLAALPDDQANDIPDAKP